MKCEYLDCGWCYSPEHIENNSKNGECHDPKNCPHMKNKTEPVLSDDVKEYWLEGTLPPEVPISYSQCPGECYDEFWEETNQPTFDVKQLFADWKAKNPNTYVMKYYCHELPLI